MNSTKKNKSAILGIGNQEPLRVMNRIAYNPLVHTLPTGLEKNIILEPTMYPSRTAVRQHPPAEFKPGPDVKSESDYGQFVELGGRRRKTRKIKRRRSKKSIGKRRSKKHRK